MGMKLISGPRAQGEVMLSPVGGAVLNAGRISDG